MITDFPMVRKDRIQLTSASVAPFYNGNVKVYRLKKNGQKGKLLRIEEPNRGS